MPDADSALPREVSREIVVHGKSLDYHRIIWQDATGQTRLWESVERVKDRAAVMTIPWLLPSRTLVLIRQFRPPAGGPVIEFPAGLIDDGETAEEAALRELREETGYIGAISQMIPPTFNTPGLSGEAVFHAFLAIDESDAANRHPEAMPDEGEHIETVLVSEKDMEAFLVREQARGSSFDSKVMSYLLGMTGVAPSFSAGGA